MALPLTTARKQGASTPFKRQQRAMAPMPSKNSTVRREARVMPAKKCLPRPAKRG